jgi:ribose-phosphate pyrophosphokinase
MSLKLYRATHLAAAGYEEIPFSLTTFPGGEPHINSCDAVMYEGNLLIDARVRSFNDLGELLVLIHWLHKNGNTTHIYLPYFPAARQDRGNPLTVAIYVDILQDAGYETITIVDPHSDVVSALLNTPHILSIVNTGVREFLGDFTYRGLICPDAGAEKRVNAVAKATGLPVYHARKLRDPSTGEIIDVTCESLPPGRYCVVDDILDGGATFTKLIPAMTKVDIAEWWGEKYTFDLWATHTIQEKGIAAVLSIGYQRIGTTDSFIKRASDEQVKIYSLFERMLDNAK